VFRLNILLIHNYYQQPGGERVVVSSLADLLRSRGHRVRLYTRDNSEITQYGPLQKTWFFANVIYSRRTYRDVQQIIVKERPDIVHVHNVFPLISPAVYQVLKNNAVPVVQTVHNFRFMCPNGLFYTHGQVCERCKFGNTLHAVRWKCYRNSYVLSLLYALSIGLHRQLGTFQIIDCFIALTEFTAQKLIESGLTKRDKIVVLGNFLSSSLPMNVVTVDQEPYILYIGRLSPEKGVEVLIEAMVKLPGLKLKIAGDGPLREKAEEIVQRWRLENVEFLGHVTGEAKWKLLNRAIATVVPSSFYETFGLTALESQAASTPVIGPRSGSLPYVIEEGKSGLLFRPGDVSDLRGTLKWLIEHPQEVSAMGKYGQKLVEQKYSAQTHYETLIKIYRKVCGQ
jgi:glycosyltransferase involved in cell wall biosynthesis